MNQRLALIDRVADELHDRRDRLSMGHGFGRGRSGTCNDCRDLATFVVDEIKPILLAAEVRA